MVVWKDWKYKNGSEDDGVGGDVFDKEVAGCQLPAAGCRLGCKFEVD